MTYPASIPEFRAALLAYNPAPDHADPIYAAQGAASPVLACVSTFDALKAAPDLTQDGLRLLLGAAHLIASGGWHGLAGEAASVLATRAGQLVNNEPAQP
jgi:acyl dehydratase